MSSSPQADALIGDLLVALKPMRSWRSEQARGDDGAVIVPGERVLVIGTWLVGNQRRLSVVCGQQILLFSCPSYAFARNWQLAQRG